MSESIPTRQQINAWLRFKYGDDTGIEAYPWPRLSGRPAVYSPCHGWVKELTDAEIRSVHVWSICPTALS